MCLGSRGVLLKIKNWISGVEGGSDGKEDVEITALEILLEWNAVGLCCLA